MNRWSKPGEAYAYETGYIEGRADAVKHGRWEDGKCSVCGEHALFWMMSSGYYASPYCPNCGARMSADNATPHAECVVNLYTETKLRFVLDECIEDEKLIEKILKALDEVKE